MKVGLYNHRHGQDLLVVPDDFPVGFYNDDSMSDDELERVQSLVEFELRRGETFEVAELEGAADLARVTTLTGPAGSLDISNQQAITLGMTMARHYLEHGTEDDMNGGDLVSAFNEFVEECVSNLKRRDYALEEGEEPDDEDDDEDGEEQEPGEDD